MKVCSIAVQCIRDFFFGCGWKRKNRIVESSFFFYSTFTFSREKMRVSESKETVERGNTDIHLSFTCPKLSNIFIWETHPLLSLFPSSFFSSFWLHTTKFERREI